MFLLFKFLVSLYVLYRIYFTNIDKSNINEIEPPALQYNLPGSSLNEDEWRNIGNPSNRKQVYSAYYDDRPYIRKVYSRGNGKTVGVVKIISILPYKTSANNLTCYFRYSNLGVSRKTSFDVEAYKENGGLPFSASVITCGVQWNIINTTTRMIPLPKFVAVSDGSLHIEQLQYIPIRYPLKIDESENKNLAVCVPPLFNCYNKEGTIIEYIELYKILGVQHFFFYNLSISDRVSKVLQYYQKKGLVTVQEWNFDGYEFEQEVRYNGIFAAINDCLFRSSFEHGFEYTINTDIDEILIPKKHNNLLQLLSKVRPNEAGIVFRNAFFDMLSKNIPSKGKNFLATQSVVYRTVENFPPLMRSKYIYKGKGIIELGNHLIWKYYPGFKYLFVPEFIGLSHHYRYGCLGYCNPENLVVDKSARRYELQLATNVDKAYSEIFEKE